MTFKIIFTLLVAGFTFENAFADSAIECELKGGSEQSLMSAPKSFEVNEAGTVTLYASNNKGKTEELLSIELNSKEAFYYASQDIKLSVRAERNVIGAGDVVGLDVFTIKGCVNETDTTAIYSFQYKIKRKAATTGAATYDCTCALD